MASDAGVVCENKVLPWLSAFLSAARVLFAAALLATLPGIGGGAWAQGIDEKGVSANWSLVPSDLSVGDRFRLLFITSTQRNAESTDIDDYNAHVQNAATLADDSIIRSYSDGFRVLGCTTSVNARTNTETTSGDTDAFVYWLDGEKVADTYADLYDGSWDSFNRKTEDADDVVPAVAVYTGCLNNGNTDAGEQLGASHARFSSDNAPFKSGFSLGTFANKPFYALSQVFLITDVPDITGVSVTSTPTAAADTYGGGGVIEITVRFDEPVTVTGDPHFEFSLGNSGAATPRDAAYASGSGTDRLVFRYTVQADDEDNNGIWIGQNVVILDADDAIRDGDDNDALLTHAGKGAQSGHKVDGSLPPRVIISGISLTSAPMVANAYRLGEAIEITVTFEEAVTVTGNPSFRLRMGNASGTVSDKDAAYVSGSGTDALVFRYTVQVGDEDDNGIWIEENAVILNAGDAIRDGDGDDALLIHTARGNQNSHKVDGSLMPPVAITDVSVTSMPTAAPDTYGLGEAIEITVTFEEAVTVTGNPSFRLRMGNASGTVSDKDAAYVSGSGTDALVFRYTVQADDEDDNGIWLEENAVILDAGDAIQDGDGDDALLIHTARGNQNSHKVDGMNDAVAPVLQSAVVDGVTLSLGYDDMLDGASVPAAGAFTVTAGGVVVALSGSDPVSISDAMVTLTLAAPVAAGEGVTVSYTAPSGPGAAPIRNGDGNNAAALSNHPVDNVTTPVLALSADPDTIAEDGGASVVTVEITNGVTFAEDQTITLALGGTAALTDDYTITGESLTLTLVAGEGSVATTVTAVADVVDDDGETVVITATHDGTGTGTGIGSATITITDDDAAPVLSLSADPDTIAEDGGASVVTVEITNGVTFAEDQTITLSLGGTATLTDDYTITGESLTLTLVAGEGSVATTVTAVADVVDDDGETIILTATHDGIGTGIGSATITITDEDVAPVLSLSVDPDTIAEDGGASVVTVEITNGVTFAEDQTITLALSGTATLTDDYTITGESLTLTLMAGEGSVATTVTAVADVVDDDGETITITATHDGTGIGSATITITDDDAAPELELLVSEATIAETGGGSIMMVRSVNGITFPADQTITLSLSGTAAMGEDYMIDRPDLTLILAAGMTESAPVTLTAMDDSINDGDEMIEIVAMLDGTPVGAMQTVMIVGDDDPDTSDLEEPRKEEATTLLRRHVDRFASVSSGAALGRLQGLAPPTTVNAQISARNHKLDASWTGEGAKGSGWAGWSRLFYGWVEGPGDGAVYDLYLGVDWRAPDGRYVIGGMLGHEGADLRLDEGGRFRSRITQVGVYGATYLSENMILDGALAYGFGWPELSQGEGANQVTAKYDTKRLTLRADLTGGLNWRDGAMVIEPQLGVLHVQEKLGAFTDSAGVSGAAETLRLTRFGIGPRLTWMLPKGTFTGRARVNWDRHNLDNEQASDLSASLDARLRYDLEGGLSAEFFGAADGIGLSGDQRSYTAGVSVKFRF